MFHGLSCDMVQAENLRIDHDATQWLAVAVAGDRGKVRAEMEKLITYKGDEQTPISIADVQAACGGGGVQDFDDLVYNVAGRNSAAALKAYGVLMAEGIVFIALLRALQNHFRRLHMTKAHISDGIDLDSAMKKLSPPVFFKQAPMFKAQVNSWSLPVLNGVLRKLGDLEAQCKQTGMPVETLCAQAILAISKIRTG